MNEEQFKYVNETSYQYYTNTNSNDTNTNNNTNNNNANSSSSSSSSSSLFSTSPSSLNSQFINNTELNIYNSILPQSADLELWNAYYAWNDNISSTSTNCNLYTTNANHQNIIDNKLLFLKNIENIKILWQTTETSDNKINNDDHQKLTIQNGSILNDSKNVVVSNTNNSIATNAINNDNDENNKSKKSFADVIKTTIPVNNHITHSVSFEVPINKHKNQQFDKLSTSSSSISAKQSCSNADKTSRNVRVRNNSERNSKRKMSISSTTNNNPKTGATLITPRRPKCERKRSIDSSYATTKNEEILPNNSAIDASFRDIKPDSKYGLDSFDDDNLIIKKRINNVETSKVSTRKKQIIDENQNKKQHKTKKQIQIEIMNKDENEFENEVEDEQEYDQEQDDQEENDSLKNNNKNVTNEPTNSNSTNAKSNRKQQTTRISNNYNKKTSYTRRNTQYKRVLKRDNYLHELFQSLKQILYIICDYLLKILILVVKNVYSTTFIIVSLLKLFTNSLINHTVLILKTTKFYVYEYIWLKLYWFINKAVDYLKKQKISIQKKINERKINNNSHLNENGNLNHHHHQYDNNNECSRNHASTIKYTNGNRLNTKPNECNHTGLTICDRFFAKIRKFIGILTNRKRNGVEKKISFKNTDQILQIIKNIIYCEKCKSLHKRFEIINRKIESGRYCSRCFSYHKVKDNDLWIESSFWSYKYRIYACFKDQIYDVTEWFMCKIKEFDKIEANTHTMKYRINDNVNYGALDSIVKVTSDKDHDNNNSKSDNNACNGNDHKQQQQQRTDRCDRCDRCNNCKNRIKYQIKRSNNANTQNEIIETLENEIDNEHLIDDILNNIESSLNKN